MPNSVKVKVLDVITTPQGAKRLLAHRVATIDKDPLFENYLVSPEEATFTGDFSSRGITLIPFPMSRGLSPLTTIREIRAFGKLLSTLKPDIIHAHTSKAGAVSRIAAARYNFLKPREEKILVLYQVHSFYFNALGGLKKALYLAFEVILARLSHALLFQNAEELDQAKRAHMLPASRLINIGNGVNLNEFSLPPAPLPFPDKKPFPIICVARVEEKKNHRMLIEVAELLEKRRGKGSIIIRCVGEIGMSEIPALAEKRGLCSSIEFLGLKDRVELSACLRASRLSVLTSSAEGKPRALMESMAFALPCVATNVTGTRDVVQNGVTGFLVPYNDVEAFASAMEELMDNPALYAACSQASQRRAQEAFDEDRVIEKLKELYCRELEKLRNPAAGR